jgi:transposase InsO family protein
MMKVLSARIRHGRPATMWSTDRTARSRQSHSAPQCGQPCPQKTVVTIGLEFRRAHSRGTLSAGFGSVRNKLATLISKPGAETLDCSSCWRNGAYIRAWTSETQRHAGYHQFIHFYNHHRPHGSLGWATPISIIRENLPAKHT